MIFILLFTFITLCTIVAICRSGKSIKHICREIKFELIYQYLELPNKHGQIAIVTGGSRGLGIEIVKMLMQCDMHVIIGCRNVNVAEKLEPGFRKDGITTGKLEVFQIDTSSIKSVKDFAAKIKEKYAKINILINNAGIMFAPYAESDDGFESQFAVNYLGHFLLTHLLMPQLIAAGNDTNINSRIINVSSIAHFAGDINFEDINLKEQFISAEAYSQSKLAQILFTNYLQDQLTSANNPIQVNSVHPGICDTDLFNATPLKKICPWLPGLLFKNPAEGATSIVYAAVSPDLEGKGSTYISNCRIAPTSSIANSVQLQEKFFNFTKKLLNIDQFGNN